MFKRIKHNIPLSIYAVCEAQPFNVLRGAKIMMARRLLKNGVSLDLIIESAGLSRETLISLQ
ncbi:hypothetical protein ACHCAL_10615 [Providencia huaxiensis]|uniref:hypothetical protein n=1 Tax=Providencia huaxiensis TaxID=2027290 RepID=UPI00375817E3